MSIPKTDITLLNDHFRTIWNGQYHYDTIIKFLAKYTIEEWIKAHSIESMIYWTITFGITKWIPHIIPGIQSIRGQIYVPVPEVPIKKIIKMSDILCKYLHTEYAGKMIMLTILDQKVLSDILQLAEHINDYFGYLADDYSIINYLNTSIIHRHLNLMDLLLSMGYKSNNYYLAYEYNGELLDTNNQGALHVREQYQLYCIERIKAY